MSEAGRVMFQLTIVHGVSGGKFTGTFKHVYVSLCLCFIDNQMED